MRWKLTVICIFLLLSSCSYIKVDDSNEEQTIPNVKEDKTVDQVISDLKIFDWSERKILQAETIYYLALGDSLTRGIGDETNQYGFTSILAKEMQKSPNVLCVTGTNGKTTTTNMVADILSQSGMKVVSNRYGSIKSKGFKIPYKPESIRTLSFKTSKFSDGIE